MNKRELKEQIVQLEMLNATLEEKIVLLEDLNTSLEKKIAVLDTLNVKLEELNKELLKEIVDLTFQNNCCHDSIGMTD